MGGAFARIPDVTQNVAVPDVVRPFRPAPGSNVGPIKSPLVTAGEGIAEGADQLSKVLEVQQRHQTILDADTAEENAKIAGIGQLAQIKQTLPGNQWAPALKDWADKYSGTALADPANSHIRMYLGKRLPLIMGQLQNEALTSGMAETAQNQLAQYNQGQKLRAASAGAAFTVAPDGSITDGPEAKAIDAKEISMQNAMWANNPDKRALLATQYQTQKIQERAQALARNPDTAKYTSDYLKANPGMFSPQEATTLVMLGNQAREARQKAADADYAQKRSDEMDYQKQYIAKNGQPDWTRLNHAAQFHDITDEDFRRVAGRDYQMPSDPVTLTNYHKMIDDAPSLDALETIKADARTAADHKILSGADIPMIDDRVDKRKEYIKTTVGKADLDAKNMLRRIYYPTDEIDRSFERNTGAYAQAYQQAEGVYKSEMVGKDSDASAPWAAYEKATKAFPRPENPYKPKDKAVAPPPVSDEEARWLAEYGKKNGLIPKGGAASGGF